MIFFVFSENHLQLEITVIKCPFFLSSSFKKETVAKAMLYF
jgi:hypothetical protein